jgi:hypothetical protein
MRWLSNLLVLLLLLLLVVVVVLAPVGGSGGVLQMSRFPAGPRRRSNQRLPKYQAEIASPDVGDNLMLNSADASVVDRNSQANS